MRYDSFIITLSNLNGEFKWCSMYSDCHGISGCQSSVAISRWSSLNYLPVLLIIWR